jgi:hypothetical protein
MVRKFELKLRITQKDFFKYTFNLYGVGCEKEDSEISLSSLRGVCRSWRLFFKWDEGRSVGE